MITPKQQSLLSKLPQEFITTFQLQVLESPEFSLNQNIANRVTQIILEIQAIHVEPRTIAPQLSKAEIFIHIYSGKYQVQIDAHGNPICPF